jgi:ABC-type methionine transport system permease subunit
MIKSNTYSHSGFKYGVIVILLILNLFVYSYVLYMIQNDLKFRPKNFGESNILSVIIELINCLLVVSIGIVSVVGLIKSIKGISESNTLKKIIGFIVNSAVSTLFIILIVVVIKNIFHAL